MEAYKVVNGKICKLVFAKSIVKNGRTIYPKKSKVFRFWIPIDEAA